MSRPVCLSACRSVNNIALSLLLDTISLFVTHLRIGFMSVKIRLPSIFHKGIWGNEGVDPRVFNLASELSV